MRRLAECLYENCPVAPRAPNAWTKADPRAADSSATALKEAIAKLEAYLAGELDWYSAYPKAEGRISSASGYLNEEY